MGPVYGRSLVRCACFQRVCGKRFLSRKCWVPSDMANRRRHPGLTDPSNQSAAMQGPQKRLAMGDRSQSDNSKQSVLCTSGRADSLFRALKAKLLVKNLTIMLGTAALAVIPAGCVQVQVPKSPTVAVLPTRPLVTATPASNKSFEAFQQDQAACMQDASHTVAGGAEAANNEAVGSAALGTVLGAGLGAAIGAASGSPGIGAAIGAASGAVLGTSIAASSASDSQYNLQQRYDWVYAQCMYAKGEQVPGFAPSAPSPSPLPG
jgi:hypothetical protein